MTHQKPQNERKFDNLEMLKLAGELMPAVRARALVFQTEREQQFYRAGIYNALHAAGLTLSQLTDVDQFVQHILATAKR